MTDMNISATYDDPNDRDNASRLIEIGKNNFTKVDVPEFGDVILFRIYGQAAHLGIYIDSRKFLHTAEKTGSIMEDLEKWDKRIEGYYRHGK